MSYNVEFVSGKENILNVMKEIEESLDHEFHLDILEELKEFTENCRGETTEDIKKRMCDTFDLYKLVIEKTSETRIDSVTEDKFGVKKTSVINNDRDTQLQKNNLECFLPEVNDILGYETNFLPNLDKETIRGLTETKQYYQHNVEHLDYSDGDLGLVVAYKNNKVVATVWVHFNDDYATFIGIRGTIPYLLARNVERSLSQTERSLIPISKLLIPKVIEIARERGVKMLYTDPMKNMHRMLTEHYNFKEKLVDYDIKHLNGWDADFWCRMTEEQIASEKEYLATKGEEWDDSFADQSDYFVTLDLNSLE